MPTAHSTSFMANHVLYHLEDIDGGLAEIKRVLKPDGKLLAATDSIHTLPELQILLRRAIVLLTSNGASQVHPPDLPCNAFALENGTRMLARHFFAVPSAMTCRASLSSPTLTRRWTIWKVCASCVSTACPMMSNGDNMMLDDAPANHPAYPHHGQAGDQDALRRPGPLRDSGGFIEALSNRRKISSIHFIKGKLSGWRQR